MLDRIPLFFPEHIAEESDTFMIPFASQMTIMAVGMDVGDFIEFQLVHVPSMNPDKCACPPGQVVLPSVAGFAILKCCGEPIRLTADNPVVILDSPQRMFLRAVLTASDTSGIFAWAVESDTHNVNDRLRGCPCPEVSA